MVPDAEVAGQPGVGDLGDGGSGRVDVAEAVALEGIARQD